MESSLQKVLFALLGVSSTLLGISSIGILGFHITVIPKIGSASNDFPGLE